ncbi:MAG: hypothetical protein ACE5FZ_06070 [Nitrospiria bacterium]
MVSFLYVRWRLIYASQFVEKVIIPAKAGIQGFEKGHRNRSGRIRL